MRIIRLLAAFASALAIQGCEKAEVDPISTSRAVLITHYGDEVVVRSEVAENGVVCGYASVPGVFDYFAFLIEGDRLVLFSEDPEPFNRCGGAFVVPLIAPTSIID
ncbi:MAG: hypothetical protein SWI22_12850 [Pseudomonadota bacterium]|nr:hypothetical protein [Pseudomonadota bacterium]